MNIANAKKIGTVKRDGENYNQKDTDILACENTEKNYVAGKLYIRYRRLKVDVLEVRSEKKLELRNFNDTS